MHLSRWPRRWPFLLVLTTVLSARPLAAGEIPLSAIENATLVPGELLDLPSIIALHPQRSVLAPAQMTALANTGATTTDRTLFGIARTERHAVFVLTQPMLLQTGSSFSSLSIAPVLQGGWALKAGPLRLGTAIRGARERSSEVSSSVSSGSFGTREDVDEDLVRLRETAVGLGLGEGAAFLDISFEIVSREFRANGLRRFDLDADVVALRVESNSRYGVWMRAGLPISADLSLRAAGGYADETSELTLTQGSSPMVPVTTLDEIAGQRWEASLSLHSSTAALDWDLWTRYANQRGLTAGATSSSTVIYGIRELDHVEGGVSIRRGIWWKLDLYSGVRSSYETVDRQEFRTDAGGSTKIRLEEDEIGDAFSWGLSRDFQDFTLGASLRTTLALSDPLATVDASFRF